MRTGWKLVTKLVILLLAFGALAAAETLSDPADFAGFAIGSDGNLVRWERIVDYMKRADEASPRIRTEQIGTTTLGNPFLLVTISSPENLAHLDAIQSRQRRIAHPDGLSEGEARKLANEPPAVLLITLNIHSTEIGSSQMALELVHRLATERSDWIDHVLDNVVFLLVPSMNPDGQIMVVDWYNETKGTEHAGASMPWAYHHYTGHDNNRDGFMMTQKESQLLAKVLYRDWYPQVYLDEHQMGQTDARIFVPPWTNPINPNVDPVIWGENGLLGYAMFSALHEAGKTGIINDTIYTSWWRGGFAMDAWWHNTVGLLTEVASARVATPTEQEKAMLGIPPKGPAPSREEMRRRLENDPGATLPAPRDVMPRNNYPRPWLGGQWTLRDIVDYELIVTYTLLEGVANNRTMLIANQIQMGQRAIETGKKGGPYAFVFPAEQHDPGAATQLLQVLQQADVDIHQATEPFEADGKTFSAGSHVVLMAQPFRPYAKDLLEVQKHPTPSDFPPGTMSEQPYDVTGWTAPLQMGVRTETIDNPFEAKLSKLSSVSLPPGTLESSGAGGFGFLISPEPNAKSTATNRLLKAGAKVSWVSQAVEVSGQRYPVGSLLVEDADADMVRGLVRDLSLKGVELSQPLDAPRRRLRIPRLALYQPWTASMDEGWTRWILEKHDFTYETVHNADLQAGSLGDRFDVIVFPGDRDAKQILEGNTSKVTPPAYKGGIGESGLAALEAFVRGGGSLVLMDRATSLAVEHWPIPLMDVLKGLKRSEFSCPGSLLEIQVDNRRPVAYGMPTEAIANFSGSAAFTITPGFSYTDVSVIARYPDHDPLRSGWIQGDEHLRQRIAAAEVKFDRGRIVLIGFRPQFRAQPLNTFKLLFNAIHESALGEPTVPGSVTDAGH
jgi:Zinc carboxypeptidase